MPRPPAPTSATFTVSSTAECTRGNATPASAEAAVTLPVVLMNSRRFESEELECFGMRQDSTVPPRASMGNRDRAYFFIVAANAALMWGTSP